MQPGQIKRAAQDAFLAFQIADENRRLEYSWAIKVVIADKFPKRKPFSPKAGVWLPGMP